MMRKGASEEESANEEVPTVSEGYDNVREKGSIVDDIEESCCAGEKSKHLQVETIAREDRGGERARGEGSAKCWQQRDVLTRVA